MNSQRWHVSIMGLAVAAHSTVSQYKALALLQAYFDESGTHQSSDIVLIAGFVARSSVWAAIEKEWQEQLSVIPVEYFHAYECESGDGIYQGLSRGIRDSLFNGVSGVIAKHKPLCVSAAVIRQDWDKYKSGIIGRAFVDPYHLCFEYCMQKISSWSKEEVEGEPVALIFAEQQEYMPRAGETYKLYRNNPRWGKELASLTFAPAKNVIPLQAADLICYETQRYAAGRRKDINTLLRPAMQKFVDANMRAIGGYYDAEGFEKLEKQDPIKL